MTPQLAFILTFAVFFAFVSALVSAVETAIVILNEGQRKRLRESTPKLAGLLDSQKKHPRRLENALLLANTLANLPLIVLCLILLRRIPWTTNFSEALSALIVFGAVILFCEVVPKMVGLAYPVIISRYAFPTAVRLSAFLAPICVGLQQLCRRIVDGVIEEKPVPQALTDDELGTLISVAQEEGNLLADESKMIHEIMDLAHKNVKHCMTPRVDIFAVPDDLSNEKAVELLQGQRFRRVLVQGESPDDIVGILEVRKILLNPGEHYLELTDPPSFVPETMNALELLRSFLSRKQAMAIIVDEYGGIEGIVTLSDLVEEVMSTAMPTEEPELYIERLGDGRVLVSGSARLDDLASVLGVEFHEDGVDTIGGFVLNRVGHLPRQGMRLPFHGWEIVVRRATRKRIKELLLERHEAGGKGKENGEEGK